MRYLLLAGQFYPKRDLSIAVLLFLLTHWGDVCSFGAASLFHLGEKSMQNENIENTYAYQACQSILAGDQKAAIDYAKKAFPTLLDDPETYCLTTVELLDLAQNHHLEISLALNGGFRTGIYLGAKSALGLHSHKGCDGRTHQVLPVELLRYYPNSLGKVWRIDRKTPAKSVYRIFCSLRQSIVTRLISVSYFSPLVYFN